MDSERESLKHFAAKHNFTYMSSKHISGYGSIPTYASILKLLPFGRMSSGVKGTTDSGRRFQMLKLKLSNSLTRRLPQEANVLLVQVDTNYYTPQIIINSTGSTVLPVDYSSITPMELEGDVPDFMNVYVADGHRYNSLILLAPNIITKLLSSRRLCDIEVYCGSIMYYWEASTISIAEAYVLSQELTDIIEPELRLIDQKNHDTTAPELKLKLKKVWHPADLLFPVIIVAALYSLIANSDIPIGVTIAVLFLLLFGVYLVATRLTEFRRRQEKSKYERMIAKYSSHNPQT